MHKHVLIPTDGSPLSFKALEHGVRFAKEYRARVTFITVTEPFHTFATDVIQLTDTPAEYKQHSSQRAARILETAKQVAETAGVVCEAIHSEHDHPYQAIIDTAGKLDCDLIVMASHGRRGMSAIVLGSETVKVLTHSTIPVLVYR